MKLEHTPGPWYSIGNEVFKDFPTHRYEIACANHNSMNQSANARLIAAAPELLAALERLVSLIHIYAPEADTDPGSALHQAATAIGKAGGGSDKLPKKELSA